MSDFEDYVDGLLRLSNQAIGNRIERTQVIHLTSEQSRIVDELENLESAAVKGPPGTGKSIALLALAHRLLKRADINQVTVVTPNRILLEYLTELGPRLDSFDGARPIVRDRAEQLKEISKHLEIECRIDEAIIYSTIKKSVAILGDPELDSSMVDRIAHSSHLIEHELYGKGAGKKEFASRFMSKWEDKFSDEKLQTRVDETLAWEASIRSEMDNLRVYSPNYFCVKGIEALSASRRELSGVVLVDEAQDFSWSALRLLGRLARRLYIFGDYNQQIGTPFFDTSYDFERTAQAIGLEPYELTKNLRSTSPIVAKCEDYRQEVGIGEPLVGIESDRHGPPVFVSLCEDDEEAYEMLTTRLLLMTGVQRIPAHSILIVTAGREIDPIALKIGETLRIQCIELEQLQAQEEPVDAIRVVRFHEARGIESPNVIILANTGVESHTHVEGLYSRLVNPLLIYTAMSRATDQLELIVTPQFIRETEDRALAKIVGWNQPKESGNRASGSGSETSESTIDRYWALFSPFKGYLESEENPWSDYEGNEGYDSYDPPDDWD